MHTRLLGTLIPIASMAMLTTCIHLDLAMSPREFQEFIIEDNEVDEKVALVDISGVMTMAEDQNPFGFGGGSDNIVGRTKEQLDRAADDPDVKAVVIRISSPGGEVYPSFSIHREIKRFREDTDKPVVAYISDVGASGGYMAALGAEEIMADELAITGSIGVIAIIPEVTGLLKWARIEMHTIKAGEQKDLGSPFRDMTDEDRAELQRLVGHYHGIFKKLVTDGRSKLASEQVETLADGRVFTAADALEEGLIDAVGRLEDAHGRAAAMAELSADTTNLVMYRRPGEYHRSVYTMPPHDGVHVTLDLGSLSSYPKARFLFLWHPGG